MAATFSEANVYNTAIVTFQDALAVAVDDFAPFTTMFTDNAAILRLNATESAPASTTWDGVSDITLTTLGVTHKQELTPVKRQIGVKVPREEINRLGLDVAVGGRMMAAMKRLGLDIQHLAFTGLLAGFGFSVPDGASGTVYALSAGHLLGDGVTTQSNLINDLPSPAAIEATQAMVAGWLDSRGLPMRLSTRDRVLVGDVGYEGQFGAFIKSRTTTVVTEAIGGAVARVDGQYNPLADKGLSYVTYPFASIAGGDPDMWFNMPRGGLDPVGHLPSPFVMWMPSRPVIEVNGVTPVNDDMAVHILITFELVTAWTAPATTAAIGSYPT